LCSSTHRRRGSDDSGNDDDDNDDNDVLEWRLAVAVAVMTAALTTRLAAATT
jgi:hypothetical protein